MHKLVFYGGKGHTDVTWETAWRGRQGTAEAAEVAEAEAAIEEAKRIFEEALSVGGAAFKVIGGVETSERITVFDPEASEIHIVFPMDAG